MTQQPDPVGSDPVGSGCWVGGRVERQMFAAARAGAVRVLAGEPDLTVFATWCLGMLQGVAPGSLRHAACDGVLSALEETGRDSSAY